MSGVFETQVQRYEAWYATAAGQAACEDEIAALRPLVQGLPRPWLEVGVGTGRMAAALGADLGIDPAPGALRLAAGRGVRVAVARGEALPFADASCGAVLLTLTLCFVANPGAVLREVRRVLRPDGALVLGLLLADGPWGRHYQELGAWGHAYYQHARFLTRPDLADLARAAGLRQSRVRSALFWPPDHAPGARGARDGDDPSAGFTAMLLLPGAIEPAVANPEG